MLEFKENIEIYLNEVKELIKNNRYIISKGPNRRENMKLFDDYNIDMGMVKDILLKLEVTDFSNVVRNIHKGYEHEILYIFGKDIPLLQKYGDGEKLVSLYIKINKVDSNRVIVVSFHEQSYPLKYYFKS